MNNNIKKSFSKTLLALSIAGVSTVTQAGSFGLIEQSASGQGSAYAGASALGEDASTVYFNPAGMTRLTGQQVVVAGHVVSPRAEFTNNGSTDAFGGALPGNDSNTGDPAFVPNLYYTAELPNEIYAGIGINVPFGLSTEYDDGWVGRYHALRSEISSVNINPSIAWKATNSISVGFGINIQYMQLELTNNIDSFGACAQLDPAAGAGCAGAGLNPALGDATQDSAVKMDGDSLELGWNAGVLFDLDDRSRMGISYRSAIKHEVSGDAKYNLNPVLQGFADGATAASGFNILQDTTLDATAELPETFSLSFVGDINPKWTALFDWTWTGWSSLDSITIIQAGGVPGQEPTLDLAYKNTNRYSVGVNFKPTNKWIYRAGLAYDETPIRSPETTSARIPGNDRTWLSFGLGFAPSNSWSIDAGYSHLFISDNSINNNGGLSSSNATLIGSYALSVDILSVQANFNF